jgi:hypothetical protein
MTDSRQRQPAGDKTPHTVPVDTTVLTASRQRELPEPAYPEPKDRQRRLIHGHP